MMSTHGKFAVVLNANARRVNEQVEQLVAEVVSPDDLFLSSSQEEAEEIANVLMQRGYETVFAGGGDGTVVHLINSLSRFPQEAIPALGILKLGTGNAMARMVSSPNAIHDLKSYVGSATREFYSLSLVETEGKRYPFVGLGWDAMILNDYRFVKERFAHNKLLKPVLQNVVGYFFSFLAKTVPTYIGNCTKQAKTEIVVRNLDKAFLVGPGGKKIKEFNSGQILFQGKVTVAMAGTVPYYGYGLKILPYANKDADYFHLRLSNVGIWKGMMLFPSVWRGTYAGKSVLDFLVRKVRLELSQDMPFQTGGDAAGYRRQVEFKIVPRAVKLLRII